MTGGWRYRIASVTGAFTLAVVAVVVASHPLVQSGIVSLPVFSRLPLDPASGWELATEAVVAASVVTVSLWPLLKPRPRRILDTASIAAQRTLLATVTLAAIGYFDYTYRLPRATLIVSMTLLVCVLPAWFVAIRRRQREDDGRVLIVGDHVETIEDILESYNSSVVGYASPPETSRELTLNSETVPPTAGVTDGGTRFETLPQLGGLSQLREILVTHDIDTVVLAFAEPDRTEFFGALDTCYEHGVAAKVHRDHADVVLTSGTADGELVDIDLEPWDWLDHVTKRIFDVTFAGTALLVLSPLLLVIAVAIKLDSPGPVLYRQRRTAAFGDTFTVAKFRSMVPDSEDAAPVDDDENDRITRVGRILRRTHLDEIPQLLAILRGEMSVVGPRAVWIEEETLLEDETTAWRRRWFVKPGLTGLAQVNQASSTNPETKLRYDIEYIRRQSFWFDVKIVIRQLWMVGEDLVGHDR
ncbi:sugar transferase [Halosegnis rubeus]|uniref:Sugar transferase n=1 Tax=Halosegnis rubeus TaxID=2212850 RepID=A0A5N5UKU1_9EURY|nr:sugar transferase [Halosegnis rubeus]KAB7519433.1 sugar transferase [Halosegnis rubeus]